MNKYKLNFISKNINLLNTLFFRIGHHSTSDDSTAYRSVDEVKYWHQQDHPISRLRKYMELREWWDDKAEAEWKDETKRNVMKAFVAAEKKIKPKLSEMFNDVYDEWPENLKSQYSELIDHLKQYKEHYPIKNYEH